MASGKNFSGWVSGELLQRAQKRVDEDFRGNASDYVKACIERDLAGRKAADAPDDQILVALAKRFQPTVAAELEQQLLVGAKGPVAQARVVARFLDALHMALKGDFNPEAPFEILTGKERAKVMAAAERLHVHLDQTIGVRPEHDLPRILGDKHELNEEAGDSPAGDEIKAQGEKRRKKRDSAARAPKRAGSTPIPHR